MLHKVMIVLRAMRALYFKIWRKMSIGEISRAAKIPYSTTRRLLDKAFNSDLVDCEIVDYKSTGKRVFWLTDKGIDWLASYRELGL